MKKKLFRTTKDFKGNVALAELRRAHFIIALLATALAFVIIASTYYPIQLDHFLTAVAAALLIIVAAISLSIAFSIKFKK